MKAMLNALKRFDKVKLLKKKKKKLLSNYVLARPTTKDWGEHKNLGLCSKTVPQMSKLSFH